MKSFAKYILPAATVLVAMGISSCSSDLDIDPIDPNQKFEQNITPEELMNKCYANFAKGGQGDNDDNTDFTANDGGTTGFVRQVFNCENLTTDEAICAWGDNGIAGWNSTMPEASNPMLTMLYNRMEVGIAYCNQYINNFGSYNPAMTAEARFLRAYEYWVMLDVFGNPPFTTAISNATPQQISRKDLFAWLVNELKDIEPSLNDPAPKTDSQEGYGRVDKAADWQLLARLYLNSEVYTGVQKYDSARIYAKKVIDSPYKLYTTAKNGWSAYQQLFMGDNGSNGSSVEALFPLIQNGSTTRSYGCTRFLINGSTNNSEMMNPDGKSAGTNSDDQWSGNRARPQLIEKFFDNTDVTKDLHAYQMPAAAGDDRAIFEANGRKITNDNQKTFTDGYAVCKWNNWRTDGGQRSDDKFVDTDYFLMRSAESYLILAEADARLNGGRTTAEGTKAIDALLNRANDKKLVKASYNLDDICDEWSREFYWEGLRRPTLIRFGRFGGNSDYTWSWKGGVLSGRNVDSHFNFFPLPQDDLNANRNLKQNPGY